MLTFLRLIGKLLGVATSLSRKLLTFSKKIFWKQALDLNTRGDSLLHIALHRNCSFNAESNKGVTHLYDSSEHGALLIMVECPQVDAKPITANFRSFGNADYTEIFEMMTTKPFEATCYSNINWKSEEMYHYFRKLLQISVPRRPRHLRGFHQVLQEPPKRTWDGKTTVS